MTGVHDFYQVSKRHQVALILQFFLRTTDADVGRYLKLFTFLPLERIQQYMTEHEARIASGERTSADITLQAAPEKRSAQRVLADEITELVHGGGCWCGSCRCLLTFNSCERQEGSSRRQRSILDVARIAAGCRGALCFRRGRSPRPLDVCRCNRRASHKTCCNP